MGKIFGISDNPVSTIESALKGMHSVELPAEYSIKNIKEIPKDKFISSNKNVLTKSKINNKNFVRKMLSFIKK